MLFDRSDDGDGDDDEEDGDDDEEDDDDDVPRSWRNSR